MLLKSKIRLGIVISLFVLIIGGFYFYKSQKQDITEAITGMPKPIEEEKAIPEIKMKAKSPEILEKRDAVEGIMLGQGDIQIQGNPYALKPEGAPLGTPKIEPPTMIPDGDYNYVGVSIMNTSGKIISSSGDGTPSESEQNEMIMVENMGRTQGTDFRPQPVAALAQKDLESEELKILEQKRLKRKANFAKSLENREVRKSKYKRRD